MPGASFRHPVGTPRGVPSTAMFRPGRALREAAVTMLVGGSLRGRRDEVAVCEKPAFLVNG